MEKVRYEEMLPHEIVARRERFPAAFIGLGGLEWHGEHLGVGNDALKAEKLCELAAVKKMNHETIRMDTNVFKFMFIRVYSCLFVFIRG